MIFRWPRSTLLLALVPGNPLSRQRGTERSSQGDQAQLFLVSPISLAGHHFGGWSPRPNALGDRRPVRPNVRSSGGESLGIVALNAGKPDQPVSRVIRSPSPSELPNNPESMARIMAQVKSSEGLDSVNFAEFGLDVSRPGMAVLGLGTIVEDSRRRPRIWVGAMDGQPTLHGLKRLELVELRRIWREIRRSGSQPHQRRLLLRELAWQLQSESFGAMDADTRRLLRAAIRGAQIETSNPRAGAGKEAGPRRRARLRPGAKLVRTWRGRRYEVTVHDDGRRFRYRGQTYESLTEIAEVITSAHWSGPRFFGLHRFRRMS